MGPQLRETKLLIIIILAILLIGGVLLGLVRFNYYENKIGEISNQLESEKIKALDLNDKLIIAEKKITELTTPKEVASNVIAKKIQTVPINQSFTLKSGIEIQVYEAIQAQGGLSTIQQKDCANGVSNGRPLILMKYFDADEKGWCMDGKHFESLLGIQNPESIGVEIKVTNSGVAAIENRVDRFVKVLYQEQVGENARWKQAPPFISVGSSIAPSASQRFRAGFIVPHNTPEVIVLHGEWTSNNATDTIPLAESGYKINFIDKIVTLLNLQTIHQITL